MNETKIQDKKFLCMASEQELLDFAKRNGIESYRAKQVERWISKRWVVNPEDMTDLSKKAQQAFGEHFLCDTVKVESKTEAPDGTVKFLLRLRDGETIECALIQSGQGIAQSNRFQGTHPDKLYLKVVE